MLMSYVGGMALVRRMELWRVQPIQIKSVTNDPSIQACGLIVLQTLSIYSDVFKAIKYLALLSGSL